MIFQISITKQAEADLRSVFEYIAYELRAVQTAARQLDRLEKAIFSLDWMPERYRAYEKEPWHSRGLRIMPVDNYLVFYIPCHQTQRVEIIRVMYGGRDVDAQLNQFAENATHQSKLNDLHAALSKSELEVNSGADSEDFLTTADSLRKSV